MTSSLRHFLFGSLFPFLFVRLRCLFFFLSLSSCFGLHVHFFLVCGGTWEGPLRVRRFVPLLSVRLMCLLLSVFSCLVDAPYFLSSHSGCGLFSALWAALLAILTLAVLFTLFLALLPISAPYFGPFKSNSKYPFIQCDLCSLRSFTLLSTFCAYLVQQRLCALRRMFPLFPMLSLFSFSGVLLLLQSLGVKFARNLYYYLEAVFFPTIAFGVFDLVVSK